MQISASGRRFELYWTLPREKRLKRVNQGVAKGRPRHRHDVQIVTDRAVTVQPSCAVLCAQASKSIQLDEQMICIRYLTRQATTSDPWANFHRRRFVNRRQAASPPTSSRLSDSRQCVDPEAVCNRMSPECGAAGTGQRASVLHAARDGALHGACHVSGALSSRGCASCLPSHGPNGPLTLCALQDDECWLSSAGR